MDSVGWAFRENYNALIRGSGGEFSREESCPIRKGAWLRSGNLLRGIQKWFSKLFMKGEVISRPLRNFIKDLSILRVR